MNRYEIGNVVACLFAFTNRELTPAEQAVFIAGNGLPDGAGIDPDGVFFDYLPGAGATTLLTLTGDDVIRDDLGAYHVPLPLTARGRWRFRGRGTNSDGSPLVATLPREFEVDDGMQPC